MNAKRYEGSDDSGSYVAIFVPDPEGKYSPELYLYLREGRIDDATYYVEASIEAFEAIVVRRVETVSEAFETYFDEDSVSTGRDIFEKDESGKYVFFSGYKADSIEAYFSEGFANDAERTEEYARLATVRDAIREYLGIEVSIPEK